MQYAEFAVAEYLKEKIDNVSVFLPASTQEKGIDLLLYRHDDGHNELITMQVKMSRTYSSKKSYSEFPFTLWSKRFKIHQNASWYILVGIYAKHHNDEMGTGAVKTSWNTIMLALTNMEMAIFLSEVKQKKEPNKDDKMFGFGFDESKTIHQTRGYPEARDMSQYLIEIV